MTNQETSSPYKVEVYDKQGQLAFIASYPTSALAYEVVEYLKSTQCYSEVRVINPNGLNADD